MGFLDRITGPPQIPLKLDPGELLVGQHKCRGQDYEVGGNYCETGYFIVTTQRVLFFKKKTLSQEHYQLFSLDFQQVYRIKYNRGIYKAIIINNYPVGIVSKAAKQIYKDLKKRIKEAKKSTSVAPQPNPLQQNPTQQVLGDKRYCDQCGSPNKTNANYCTDCGNKIQ